ncbi:hypothetical protein PFICI_13137 [Pestalotiopsis fici W106-1]|uniref:AMP-activated protein kinase glycogen-binding domain-containing protein n=1 Tax=Pestalotiopsis fici (strain W106-1 / CGMCC3.15140) TaxID=1229662 RepID=W3WLA5_PESFW|nr:uncharacterized protein PFICI_13137 [Pestalotiopsis fici W106-1]ETS74653.1 hypothetical protein PFICI_13137 [Pestalotiopsis fici W106-1]
MGSFLFKWEHPASEVYVTGTFDGWKKTEKLEKVGEHFEKQVQLSDASKKIYYKFVVDGNWVTDHTAHKETDESGNENNVLTPERIVQDAPATTAIMNSAAPDSTTAALAADVPLEKDKDIKTDGLPGVFPETPAADLNKEFSVNPLPAAPGAVNPIQLAPGEKIPEHVAAESTTSNVKLDPESYEKADTLPGGVATFSSAAPTSTTAQLAAGAPIETKTDKVPEIVKESQEKAHVDPEASAVPEEVQEKAATEKELLDRVKEAPSTSEGTAGVGTEKTESTVTASEAAASVAAAGAALGAAAVAGAVAAKDIALEKGTAAASTAQASATQAATNLPDSVKAQLPESVQSAIGTTSKETTIEETAPAVPAEVKESIAEAGKSPEAAASTSAVEDKAAVEKELLKEVAPVAAIDEESKKTEAKAEPASEPSTGAAAVETPAVVKTGAAAGATTSEVISEPKTETEPAATEPATAVANGSSAPTTATPETPAKSTTNSSKPEESPATAEKKKKNRISAFFGKLKEKAAKK